MLTAMTLKLLASMDTELYRLENEHKLLIMLIDDAPVYSTEKSEINKLKQELKSINKNIAKLKEKKAIVQATPLLVVKQYVTGIIEAGLQSTIHAIKEAIKEKKLMALVNQGEVFAESQQYQQAMDCYSAAIALDPTRVELYKKRGVYSFRAKQYQSVIEDFQYVKQYYHSRHQISALKDFMQGVQRMIDEEKRALHTLSVSVDTLNQCESVYIGKSEAEVEQALKLAVLFEIVEEIESARAIYEEIAKKMPHAFHVVHIRLAAILRSEIDKGGKSALYEAVVDHYQEIIHNSAISLAEPLRIYALSEYEELKPKIAAKYRDPLNKSYDLEKWIKKAETSKAGGCYTMTVAYYQKALIEHDLKEDQLHHIYLQCMSHLFELGRYNEAASDCEQLIKLSPINPHNYMARGAVYLSMNRYEASIADFKKAKAFFPVGSPYLRDSTQKYNEAFDEMESSRAFVLSKVTETMDENAVCDRINGFKKAFQLGEETKDLAIKINYYSQAIDIAESIGYHSEQMYAKRAVCLRLQGKYAESLADFDKIVEMAEQQGHVTFDNYYQRMIAAILCNDIPKASIDLVRMLSIARESGSNVLMQKWMKMLDERILKDNAHFNAILAQASMSSESEPNSHVSSSGVARIMPMFAAGAGAGSGSSADTVKATEPAGEMSLIL